MTTVELLSNPQRQVSTHLWTLRGLDQLTRENKLSSLPFWVPNDKVKDHQFRFILLKGLTPAAAEKDDAFGLVIELLPPPVDPARGEAAASSYPGGCYVCVRVLNSEEPKTGDVADATTVLVDQSNAQVTFPELISATTARSSAFLSGQPPALSVQVTLHTGVNVFAQQITSSVSSLWSSLTTTVSKLVDTTAVVYHEGRKEFNHAVQLASAAEPPATAAPPVRPPPWEVVPHRWAERAKDWHDLTFEKIVNDEGLYLYGPDRVLTEDERHLLLQSGFNHRTLVDLYSSFDFDRDVQANLLDSAGIRQERYRLVPARVKEGIFWANYFWKCACLATCESDAQVHVLLTILNAPPAVQPKAVASTVCELSDEEVVACATDAQEAADLLQEYLSDANGEDDKFLMEAAANTCEDHTRRLEPLFRRTGLSEATQAIVGSTLRRLRERVAKYHEFCKAKEDAAVAPNAGEAKPSEALPAPAPAVAPETAEPVETVSVPETATPVKDVEVATALSAAGDGASPEPVAPPPPAGPAEPLGNAGQPAARSASGSAAAVAFPKMPWEEEDEDP